MLLFGAMSCFFSWTALGVAVLAPVVSLPVMHECGLDLGGGWPEGVPATVSGALHTTSVDANADPILAAYASLRFDGIDWSTSTARIMGSQ